MDRQASVVLLILLLNIAATSAQREQALTMLQEEESAQVLKEKVQGNEPVPAGTTVQSGVTNYTIDATVDTTKTHSVSASYAINYLNTEPAPLQEILFHLYPNAWQNEGGALTIDSVTNSEGTPFVTEITELTTLRVVLDAPLQPGSALEIRMQFEVKIPNIPNRFGYWHSDNMTSHNLGNWYPIVAVFDETGWHTEPYAYWGESFYSEIANYQVNITVPTAEVVAATGRLVSKLERAEETTTWTWEAEAVRDFVFSVSPEFKVAAKPFQGTIIHSYFGSEDGEKGQRALEIAENCLTVFPQLYGPYPYATLSVVENPDGAGGMEYPTLVLMGSGLYRRVSERSFEAIIAHEIAHQWFPFLIGDNAFVEPFLDEAFATFSEHLYWEFVYGADAAEEAWGGTRNHYYSFLNQTEKDEPINQTMAVWDKNQAYFPIIYSKGALVLRMTRLVVGNESFFRAMRVYYDRFLHKNAQIRDFIAVLEEVSAMDLDWFFTEWVFRSGLPAYEIAQVELKSGENAYELILRVQQQTRYGGTQIFRMPVPFRIQYEDHQEIRTAWVNATTQEVRFEVKDTPRTVELDPYKMILRANINQKLSKPVITGTRILKEPVIVLIGVLVLGVGGVLGWRKWRESKSKP